MMLRSILSNATAGRFAVTGLGFVLACSMLGCGPDNDSEGAIASDPVASSGRSGASEVPENRPELPTRFDLPDHICPLFDQQAIEEHLGLPTEQIEFGPQDLPAGWTGPTEWVCLTKEAGGDDQAPGVVFQFSDPGTPALTRQGFKDKEVVTAVECTSTGRINGFSSNHCTGGFDGDANVFNVWAFIGTTSVTCGVGSPSATLEATADFCLEQLSRLPGGSNEGKDLTEREGPGTAEGELLTYDPPVEITSREDVDGLEDAPPDAREFFEELYDELLDGAASQAEAGCEPAARIAVDRVRTDGWATASVWSGSEDCQTVGGNRAIYGVVDGDWQEVIAGQEAPQCSDLRAKKVPADIGGPECFEGDSVATYTGP